MREFEQGERVQYKNVLGEIRDGVVIRENKGSVRLLDGIKVLSIKKNYILEG